MGHRVFGLFALTIAACIPVGPQASYYGQAQPQPGQPQVAAASGLSCLQLFDCFQACQDGTCIQSCLGQADANVQAAASATMQCSSQKCGAGAGAECLAQQCGAEVQTCTGTVATVATYEAPQQPVAEQMRPGQPHTTANILPWMVGEWIGTNHQFTFYADGRVRRASGVALYTERGTYGCASIVNDTGTVTQEGDVLVMRFESTDVNHCHERSTEAAVTVRYRIDWRQPYGETAFSQLVLRDLDCKRGDSMYCDNTMRRR